MKKIENAVNINKDSNFLKIGKGFLISMGITIILLLIFSLLLAYTKIQESTIVPVVIVITAISILIGSSISMLQVRKNGMLLGGSVGFFYILCLYLLSGFLGSGFHLTLNSMILIIASIITGAIGGIIGVNRK